MRFCSLFFAFGLFIGSASYSFAGSRYAAVVTWKADPTHPTVQQFSLKNPSGKEAWNSGDFNQNAWWISSTGLVVGLRSPGVEGLPGVLTFYDAQGNTVREVPVRGFSGGSFCGNGSRFYVYDLDNGLTVYNAQGIEQWNLPIGDAFAPAPDGSMVAIARNGTIELCSNGSVQHCLAWTGGPIRSMAFSENGSVLAAISAGNVTVYDVTRAEALWQRRPSGPGLEFISIEPDGSAGFVTTAHDRTGKARECRWTADGTMAAGRDFSVTVPQRAAGSRPKEGTASWPLAPIDQVHPLGNGWGEYQNYGGSPYFHPGIDVMALTDIGVPVYAVAHGWVKAWLTTSGNWHWRLAIADSSTNWADSSDAWLYAHIDPARTHLNVGDEVNPGDWIGYLVEWYGMGFDHCHFARIKDAGTTWNAGGADWQFVEDPLNLMAVTDDTSRPVIEDALPGSRFAFCANNTATYLDPDSLYGDVDIVARIYDRFGQGIPIYPDWEKLNPYRIDYEIKGQFTSQPQRISFLFGHQLAYNNINLVNLTFKQDAVCTTYGDYGYRQYYYNVTNTDGDSLLEPSDTSGAWHTASFANGQYWVGVYAADQYGNTTADSQLVTVNNPSGVVGPARRSLPECR